MAAIANTAHGATASNATAATTSGAIATTAAVGECIIVAVCTVNTASSAPTDTAGNTYVALGAVATNTDRVTLWGCLKNKGASPSITCTFTSSAYAVVISTFTGVVWFIPSNTTTNTGTSAAPTATLPKGLQVTTNQSVAGFCHVGIGTWSANTGTLCNSIAGPGSAAPGGAIVLSTTTTCAPNQSASVAWAGTIIELGSAIFPENQDEYSKFDASWRTPRLYIDIASIDEPGFLGRPIMAQPTASGLAEEMITLGDVMDVGIPSAPTISIEDEFYQKSFAWLAPALEDDQSNYPIVVFVLPNIGSDNIESMFQPLPWFIPAIEEDESKFLQSPPKVIPDDSDSTIWTGTRAIQHDDTDTNRTFPPLPPEAEPETAEDFEQQSMMTAIFREIQGEDVEVTVPPPPPTSFTDNEDFQRWIAWSSPALEDDQSNFLQSPPFSIQDGEIEKTYDQRTVYDHTSDTDEPGFLAAPPFSIQDGEIEKTYDQRTVYDHTSDTDLPGTLAPPPSVFTDNEDLQKWVAWSAPALEDDQSNFLQFPPQVIPDDADSMKWFGTLAIQHDDTDTNRTFPPPPPEVEPEMAEDFEVQSLVSPLWKSIQGEDVEVTVPPRPPTTFTDNEDLQKWVAWASPALEDDQSNMLKSPPQVIPDDADSLIWVGRRAIQHDDMDTGRVEPHTPPPTAVDQLQDIKFPWPPIGEYVEDDQIIASTECRGSAGSSYTPVFIDTFTRADENPLNPATWHDTNQFPRDDLAIISNNCVPATPGLNFGAEYIVALLPNDQYVTITVGAVSSGAVYEIFARVDDGDSSTVNCYGVIAGGSLFLLFKIVAGVQTVLASVGGAPSPGDVLRLEVNGTSLTFKYNGIPLLTATDSDVAAGAAGIAVQSTTTQTDASVAYFEAGSIGSGVGVCTTFVPPIPPRAYVEPEQTWMASWRSPALEDDQSNLLPSVPKAITDDAESLIWAATKAFQYEDTDTNRTSPPTPPPAITDDAESLIWTGVRQVYHEDAETQRASPPTPPFSYEEEYKFLSGEIFKFNFADEQSGYPVAAPIVAPNIGLDDIETMIHSQDQVIKFFEDVEQTKTPRPPAAPVDETEQAKNFGWTAPWHEDPETQRERPPTPPPTIQDEISEAWKDWKQIYHDDLETQENFPPPAPSVLQDEISEQWIDRRQVFHEDAETQRAYPPPPPPAYVDEEDEKKHFGWFAPWHEDTETQRAYPPPPPTADSDELLNWFAAPPVPIPDDEGVFKTPPPPVPITGYDEPENLQWFGTRYVQHDDTDTQNTLPPTPPAIPPKSIAEEILEQWFDRRQIYHEDAETQRAFPPPPPFSYEEEYKFLAGQRYSFYLDDSEGTAYPPEFLFRLVELLLANFIALPLFEFADIQGFVATWTRSMTFAYAHPQTSSDMMPAPAEAEPVYSLSGFEAFGVLSLNNFVIEPLFDNSGFDRPGVPQ